MNRRKLSIEEQLEEVNAFRSSFSELLKAARSVVDFYGRSFPEGEKGKRIIALHKAVLLFDAWQAEYLTKQERW